ncbi:MAG: hypothetical protein ACRDKW_10900 [Actinomycetota bacterium]
MVGGPPDPPAGPGHEAEPGGTEPGPRGPETGPATQGIEPSAERPWAWGDGADPPPSPPGDAPPAWQWISDGTEPPPPTSRSLLHARTVGGILDDSIDLYRRNGRTILPLSAVVMVPLGVLSAIWSFQLTRDLQLFTDTLAAELGGRLVMIGLVMAVVWALGRSYLYGAVARLVSEWFLGRNPERREVHAFALRHFGRMLAAYVVYAVLLFLGIVPGILALTAPFFFFVTVFGFVFVVIVVEGTGVFAAFGRSWNLSRGFRWKILGTIVLVYLVKAAATYGLQALFLMVAAAIGFLSGTVETAIAVSSYLSQAVALVLFSPLSWIATTVLYFDIRIRKEGFDLALEAQELGVPVA